MIRYFHIILLTIQAQAATYYVATTGNDTTGTGAVGSPWRTIGKSVTVATAGDTVNIAAGTFTEFVTNSASGTPLNQITFQGTRGGAGEWLTIIDPSTSLSVGWVAAPEIGAGVWKNTAPFTTHELTIAGKRVAFVNTTGNIAAAASAAYHTNYITTGSQLLSLSSSATVMTINLNLVVPFWDGIESLWSASGNTTYLRLRDGSDPNGLTIRVAPNTGALSTLIPYYAGVKLSGCSNVVWKNVQVQNAVGGFYLAGGTACRNNTIQSNSVIGGVAGVFLDQEAHRNLLLGNSINCNFYGTTNTGAWAHEDLVPYGIRENHYLVSKYFMGNFGSLYDGIYLYYAGDSNVISGNFVGAGLGIGIEVQGYTDTPTYGTMVSSNQVQGQPGSGIILDEGTVNVHVCGNVLYDNNFNIRIHNLGSPLEFARSHYIYRNCGWLPDAGDQIFCHWATAPPEAYNEIVWIYHNSFNGGLGINFNENPGQTFYQQWRILNNIWSMADAMPNMFAAGMWFSATSVGAFDYNVRLPKVAPWNNPAAFEGPHEIIQNTNEWSLASFNFAIQPTSRAINAALDVSQAFVLKSVTYPALPNTAVTKSGVGWDIGALEYQFPIVATGGVKITNLKIKNVKIQ